MNGNETMRRHWSSGGGGCQIAKFAELGFSSLCQYAQENRNDCEGGGYLLWLEMKVCTESAALQFLIVVAASIFFLFLFLHLSITADAFFCENIASIVDLHKISQNIAGITFMAFGNGAPDIFSSIASVSSVKKPRADLAISSLLGGGIFVTTCVVGFIALGRPFKLMRRPILRDIGFYLAALVLLVIILHLGNHDHQMALWQPLAFLGLYLIYAGVVIFGNFFRHKMRRVFVRMVVPTKKIVPEERRRKSGGPMMKGNGFGLPPMDTNSRQMILTPPLKGKRREEVVNVEEELMTPPTMTTTSSSSVGGILVIPISSNPKDIGKDGDGDQFHAIDYLEAGKFFGKEELDAEDATTPDEEELEVEAPSSPMSIQSCDSNLSSPISSGSDRANDGIKEEFQRFCRQLAPLNLEAFKRSNWLSKLYRILKIPSLLLLKLTVPCAETSWSKPKAILHAFLTPITFCFAFQWTTMPLSHSLEGWELMLICSFILAISVTLLTKCHREPACYRWIASYFGFALSIAWIYVTAAEVLNVVMMFGNLFNIPYEILGLTAISWCNSIGDLIADVSVARQGMPRMAFSAAIGAPLFNLMIGFGTTFTIAMIQRKEITIHSDKMNNLMSIFLSLSLLTTLLLLLVQKFHIRRIHGLILLSLYILFIVCVILTHFGIINFLTF